MSEPPSCGCGHGTVKFSHQAKHDVSRMHDTLWTLCRKLPTDFTPYGERDRDTVEPWQDCSCGCRHFVKLAGELGNDWGTCANPKSPRAGLLTFEHQGCPQFEAEEETEPTQTTDAPPAALPSVQGDAPVAPRPKLKLDLGEFQLALEGFDTVGGDIVGHFLDTETGEILALCGDWDDYEELSARLDTGLGERYRRMEPLESHESFRIMEDFAASLPESGLKSRLLEALSRNRPFRRFKDVVHSDTVMRDQWFAFRDDAHERHLHAWLEAEGIDAEILRRRN